MSSEAFGGSGAAGGSRVAHGGADEDADGRGAFTAQTGREAPRQGGRHGEFVARDVKHVIRLALYVQNYPQSSTAAYQASVEALSSAQELIEQSHNFENMQVTAINSPGMPGIQRELSNAQGRLISSANSWVAARNSFICLLMADDYPLDARQIELISIIQATNDATRHSFESPAARTTTTNARAPAEPVAAGAGYTAARPAAMSAPVDHQHEVQNAAQQAMRAMRRAELQRLREEYRAGQAAPASQAQAGPVAQAAQQQADPEPPQQQQEQEQEVGGDHDDSPTAEETQKLSRRQRQRRNERERKQRAEAELISRLESLSTSEDRHNAVLRQLETEFKNISVTVRSGSETKTMSLSNYAMKHFSRDDEMYFFECFVCLTAVDWRNENTRDVATHLPFLQEEVFLYTLPCCAPRVLICSNCVRGFSGGRSNCHECGKASEEILRNLDNYRPINRDILQQLNRYADRFRQLMGVRAAGELPGEAGQGDGGPA